MNYRGCLCTVDSFSRQGEVERRTLAHVAPVPGPAAMYFNDPFYEGKANPRAFGVRIQFVKEAKDSFLIFWRDADAIIFDEENGSSILLAALADFNARVD